MCSFFQIFFVLLCVADIAAAAAGRQTIQKNTAAVGNIIDNMTSVLCSVFADICADVKPVLDVYETASRDTRQLVQSVVLQFCFKLAHSVEILCGVPNTKVSLDTSTGLVSFFSNQMAVINTAIMIGMCVYSNNFLC